MKFEAVRAAALALADTTEEPHHHYGSFRVRGKIFLTVPPDQVHIHLFLPEAEREAALAIHPACTEKLLWGGKVVGPRVALAQAQPGAVRAWIRQAHAHQAAKARSRPAPHTRAD